MGCSSVIGRVLVAVERADVDRSALEAAVAIAATSGAVARVLHVRECDLLHLNRYLESEAEAQKVVDEALFELRFAGVGASGQVVRAVTGQVAAAIDEEARRWQADAIVLGPSKARLLDRLGRRSVRRRLDRISSTMLIAMPATSRPARLEATPARPPDGGAHQVIHT